jgi:hypothetical protein
VPRPFASAGCERLGRCPASLICALHRKSAVVAQRAEALLAPNDGREQRPMATEEAAKTHAASLDANDCSTSQVGKAAQR